ncbi:S-adenosyl-L-methionine-dependent methyltransferase [Rhizopus microsporus ATCC 52813]|uniref:S-adenosyl-L-methionine-dependent methyltransferase n=1 Tax=Rhizopus microsporus ATCC 52813 TaxID=1340429 RepID=A0A2G4T7R5_RHIZD|nr:S-adenosyl-L-methionine-dependent methyltransferase [Rhizopus microsporus ATCC 52813]PHZ17065.1 S-adenosyl-L-methionine-dependent methyltransferase [Rhizopus microsporus ATCC 52813]
MATIKKVTSETEYVSMDISREFHSEDKSTYWLPKDEEEQKRLTAQHFAFKELYGGNVLPSIIRNLDFEKGVTILDVGCGSGVWMMDMIHEYPNCTFYGCDIVNTVNRMLSLENLNFSYGNVVKGLPYPDNTFDFVHMRFFVLALRVDEWPLAVKEAIRVTKPGGFIQLSDIDGKLPKEASVAYHKLMSASKFPL